MNNDRPWTLLVFAHYPEAQAFITHGQFKKFHIPQFEKITVYFKETNQGDHYLLLVTGEGENDAHEKVFFTVNYFLFTHGLRFERAINFGVCASFQSAIGSIVIPKMSMKIQADFSPQFKTYLLENFVTEKFGDYTSAVIMSTEERIVRTECNGEKILHAHRTLKVFGDLIDREVYGMSRACNFFKIPLMAIKCVSDHGMEADREIIKSQSLNFSETLWNFFQNYFLESDHEFQVSKTIPHLKDFTPKVFSHPSFYFTQTEKHQMKKYLKTLIANVPNDFEKAIHAPEEIMLQDFFKTLDPEKQYPPKKLANLYLRYVHQRIHPMDAKLQETLKNIFSPLNLPHITIHWDQSLEQSNITVSADIFSQKDFELLKNSLNNFSYQRFHNLIEKGEF